MKMRNYPPFWGLMMGGERESQIQKIGTKEKRNSLKETWGCGDVIWEEGVGEGKGSG